MRLIHGFGHRILSIAAVWAVLFGLAVAVAPDPVNAAGPPEQVEDLTAAVIPVVTLRHRDNFANEFLYEVYVENRTSRPIRGDSLMVVVDSIVDIAGKDATNRVEVVSPDGQTPDGKPYFRVPVSGNQLLPYTESESAQVRLRNPYYTILFTPSFRVLGRPVREPRVPPPAPQQPAVRVDPMNRLIELLIKKGVLTREEWLGIPKAEEETP